MRKGIIYKTRSRIVDVNELDSGNFEVEGKEYTPEEFECEFEPEKSLKEEFKCGNFFIKKEGLHIKIQHRSMDFSLRIYAGARVDEWYEQMTASTEARDAISIIASGIKVFAIESIQNAKFFHDFTQWFTDYHTKPALSKEEDQEIIKEQKEMYEEEHKDDGERPA